MTKVIYWSGTGNTEAMAEEIAGAIDGAQLIEVSDATVDDVKEADKIAFGCPSMGAEVLEEEEFEPYIESVEGELEGKKLILFGSYDWGDGEWMIDFEDRMKSAGAEVAGTLIVNLEPDDDDLAKCRDLASKL